MYDIPRSVVSPLAKAPDRRLFTCTFCWHLSRGPPNILGQSARLTCTPCLRAIINLAICWVCGGLIFRGDESVSLGWCFWHRACYGCLFCGSKRVVTAPSVAELFGDEDSGRRGTEIGPERDRSDAGGLDGLGKEIDQIPMCVDCAVGCEKDDAYALQARAMNRVDQSDGGLSRQRWNAARSATAMPVPQNQMGGDGSVDVPGSPETPGETLAKLHYRRSRDPRYAELECLVPLDSSIYVSIADPLNAPAFQPHPTKPIPAWMQMLPEYRHHHRPRSVLDAHFPPAAWVSPETDPREVTEMVCPRVQRPLPFTPRSPPLPAPSPPSHSHRQKCASPQSSGESESSSSTTDTPPPPSPLIHHKRPVDEVHTHTHKASSSHHRASPTPAREHKHEEREVIAVPVLVTRTGKGKSVAWDDTVAGGESESEASNASFERCRGNGDDACDKGDGTPEKCWTRESEGPPADTRTCSASIAVAGRKGTREVGCGIGLAYRGRRGNRG